MPDGYALTDMHQYSVKQEMCGIKSLNLSHSSPNKKQ